MKDFDLDKLERKNIYSVSDTLFDDVQNKVLGKVNPFSVEDLERKNIYKVPEDLFLEVQNNVLNEIKVEKKKAPIFNLNWAYAMAASLALIFGMTYYFYSDGVENTPKENATYAVESAVETDSEKAYETLKNDIIEVESGVVPEKTKSKNVQIAYQPTVENKENVKPKNRITERQMTEILDEFSSSEIAELASNSTSDVYLDLYN